jgi:hypothetical protein
MKNTCGGPTNKTDLIYGSLKNLFILWDNKFLSACGCLYYLANNVTLYLVGNNVVADKLLDKCIFYQLWKNTCKKC